MKQLITALVFLSMACPAASKDANEACYVRTDPAKVSASAGTAPPIASSFVGIRRKNDKLFDVDISIAGANESVCAVSGTAKLRGERGSEVLALVVRPDPGRKAARTGNVCQVFVQLTASAVELRTTATSCRAQALCEGQVEINAQRFEHSAKLPLGTKGPCFGGPAS